MTDFEIGYSAGYDRGFRSGVIYAIAPWDSMDAKLAPELHDNSTTQEEKNFCLERCPYPHDEEKCGRCRGYGVLPRSVGRPASVDADAVNAMFSAGISARDIADALGAGRSTVYRIIGGRK